MNFPNMYDRIKQVNQFLSEAGSPMKQTYRYEVVHGVKMLVPDGEEDLQAEIDAYGEIQDIHAILQRFMNGDTSVLSQSQGQYFDSTVFPKTYAEMFDMVENGKQIFRTLPAEIQDEFGNNPYDFFSSMDKPNFSERISKFKPAENVESEVKDSAE